VPGSHRKGRQDRAGKASHAKQPLPAVLGLDMAGVVEEIGPGVTGFPLDGSTGRWQQAQAAFVSPAVGNFTARQLAGEDDQPRFVKVSDCSESQELASRTKSPR
jgi:hypothetical protein